MQFQIKSGFAQFVIIHTICTISFLKAFYLSDTWLLTASGSIWQSQPHACSRSTVTRSSNPSGNIAKELFLSSGQVFRLDWMEASKVSYVINKVFFSSKDDIRRPDAHYIIHQIFMYFKILIFSHWPYYLVKIPIFYLNIFLERALRLKDVYIV